MGERLRWVTILVLVGVLVAVGVALIVYPGAGNASRDVGVSITSGGVTGLVFILAQSILAGHDDRERLRSELSINQDLTGINLRNRKIDGIALVGKPMAVADLSYTSLRNSKFVGADLRWSTFRSSDLTASVFAHANLDDTDLRDAILLRTSLRNVTLRNARLQGALFESADLSGADMSEAHLEGATFRHIAYDSKTRWPVGFEPPGSDSGALEHHRLEPDWDDYWFKHGQVAVRHADPHDAEQPVLQGAEPDLRIDKRSLFEVLRDTLWRR